MKIAILGTRGIPAKYGGFETNVEITSTALAKQGWKIFVYCRKNKKRQLEKYKNVHLIYTPSIETKFLSTFSHTFFSLLHALFHKFDLLHVYNVGNGPFLFITWLLGKKTIISVDGLEWKRKKYNFLGKLFLKFGTRCATLFANKIIVDSKHVGKYYQKKYKIKPIYIPYGAKIINTPLNTGILKELDLQEKKYFLFVGRFVPEKKIPFLIDAFKKINPPFKLAIVGGNPYDKKYENYIKSLANDKIVFPGMIYGNAVKELYAKSYLFISASELEGTSPALLESMGAGTCVIANNTPENQETIGNTEALFRLNDQDSLIKKINWFIKNPNQRNACAKRGPERIKNVYSWDKIVEEYRKIILKVIGQVK